tara:strand:+ start:615 stop:1388 length:774 start_codon:yes stop_codon:yes gene_type:complete
MIRHLVKLPFLKKLVSSIGTRFLKFFKKNRNYFKVNNIYFNLDFLDPIDREIILTHKYESDQVIFLEDQMKQTSFSYFLDIGSNCGYYSFYLADKFKDLKIKAYEPNIDAYNKSYKTLLKNSFNNIEIFNFGLSDINQKTKIRSMIKDGFVQSNSSVLYTNHQFNPEDFDVREATFKTGDEVLTFKNEKLSIKIDVEGHEIYTLKGLTNNLKNNECLLLIEISERNYHEANKFLDTVGYKNIFKSKFRPDYIYTNIN